MKKTLLRLLILLLFIQEGLFGQVLTSNPNLLISSPKRRKKSIVPAEAKYFWAEAMVQLGSHIISCLNQRPDLLALNVPDMLEEMELVGSFASHIAQGLKLDDKTQKKVDSGNPLQRDYLTAIAATMWAIVHRSAGQKIVRGAHTILDGQLLLHHFLYKYCFFVLGAENNYHPLKGFDALTGEIFELLKKSDSTFVYQRNGTRSSHLKHASLKAKLIGIDMRVSPKMPALKILPFEVTDDSFRPSHLLLGSFEGANKTGTFLKFERIGMANTKDMLMHFKYWATHIQLRKATSKPDENRRETALLSDIQKKLKEVESRLNIISAADAPLWDRLKAISQREEVLGAVLKLDFTSAYANAFDAENPDTDNDLDCRMGNERQMSRDTFKAISPDPLPFPLERIFQMGLVIEPAY